MGLFALPLSKTARGNVEEAIANLNLYLENSKYDGDMDYLLNFAKSCIEEAQNKIKKKV